MNITYVYADSPEEWNCAEWRIAIPARAIEKTGNHSAKMIYHIDFMHNTAEAQASCAQADIIVVQRNLIGRMLTMIQHWKALEKTIIADFDDAYNLMHPTVKNHKFWIEGLIAVKGPDGNEHDEKINPNPLTQFKMGLRLVNAATVPCRQLAEDWKDYTSVNIVPNYLELSKYLSVQPPEPHPEIVIGWGGSLSHLQSFTNSGVLKALKNVCRKRPQVRVLICGDERVYEKINLPKKQKKYYPYVPIDQWPELLRWFDIGIAPLEGEYDKRRSWIKVLEYMIMKIPWIASNYPAYEDLTQFGKLVNNKAEEWEDAILDVVDNIEDYRNKAATESYQYACQQGIEENINRIISLYARIIKRNQEVYHI